MSDQGLIIYILHVSFTEMHSYLVFPPLRYFPKSRKAAALLLYNLWSEKDLQSFLKKVS